MPHSTAEPLCHVLHSTTEEFYSNDVVSRGCVIAVGMKVPVTCQFNGLTQSVVQLRLHTLKAQTSHTQNSIIEKPAETLGLCRFINYIAWSV
jgi:hypothetical protein